MTLCTDDVYKIAIDNVEIQSIWRKGSNVDPNQMQMTSQKKYISDSVISSASLHVSSFGNWCHSEPALACVTSESFNIAMEKRKKRKSKSNRDYNVSKEMYREGTLTPRSKVHLAILDRFQTVDIQKGSKAHGADGESRSKLWL